MLVERVVDGCMGCLKLFFVVELDIRAANFKKKRGEVVGRNLPCNLTKLINI